MKIVCLFLVLLSIASIDVEAQTDPQCCGDTCCQALGGFCKYQPNCPSPKKWTQKFCSIDCPECGCCFMP